ncbi:MAG: sulfatase-like hydrolase/transferase [Anaerohalosphaera sp.]|nr:sulfatase-like hydrolase/transferase [Anaerohalosphaera sp.]
MCLSRRDFFKVAGVSVGAVVAGCGMVDGNLSSKPKQRPNIIFLLTDDQRDNSLGIMGHPWVKTPNLDRLVRNGVRFSNAYIAEPVCSPSRVSFFTGMHERVHGVGFTSSYKLNEDQWSKSYPAILRGSGYYTGFIGKFGLEYYTFRGDAGKKFDYYRGHDGWAKFFPKTAGNCKEYWDSEEEIITPVMGESIKRFLDTAPKDKPFNLSVSFSIPHGSQTGSMHKWSEAANKNPKLTDHPVYGDLYRDINVPIPEDTGTDPYRFIPKKVMDQDKGRRTRTYTYDYTKEQCYEHHIRYYQQITGLDKIVGEMMEALKAKGLDENTVIIFGSDHGLLMGEYGMGGKALLYDLASKFPCFVYDPRLPKKRRGKTVDKLVSSLDVTSTIVDYGGVEQPGEMQGQSLRSLVLGKSVRWRDELFLESLFTGRDTPFAEGIRKGKWKYIRMFDGIAPYKEKHVDFKNRKPDFEQLFDLSQDGEEKNNLIAELEGSETLNALRNRCAVLSDELNRQREEYTKTHEVTAR